MMFKLNKNRYPDDVTCAGKSADGSAHNFGSMCWSQQLEKYRAELTDILGPQGRLYCTEYSGGLFQNTYDHSCACLPLCLIRQQLVGMFSTCRA
jgi:hypothetical protein